MPAEDICILDHNSRDGSTDPQNLPVGVHVRQIHGDETFSPMDFMNRQVDLQIHRLLMAGYRCVFFTEVDEIVTADPEVYPGGLAEYFRQFLANSSVDVVQVTRQRGLCRIGAAHRHDPTYLAAEKLLVPRHHVQQACKFSCA